MYIEGLYTTAEHNYHIITINGISRENSLKLNTHTCHNKYHIFTH